MTSTRRTWNIVCALGIFAVATACNFKCGNAGPTGSTSAAEGETHVAGPYLTRPTEESRLGAPEAVAHNTPTFYVVWAAPLNAGEVVTGTLVAVNTNGAAPPNTTVLAPTYTSTAQAHQWGVFDFSMPTAGWPPGQYRVDVTRASGPMGSVAFNVQ